MTFNEALIHLGIEKYTDRIWKSNSHGELFHLQQYCKLAEIFKDDTNAKLWFLPWFEAVVEMAEESWDRPESVFQHIGKILYKSI